MSTQAAAQARRLAVKDSHRGGLDPRQGGESLFDLGQADALSLDFDDPVGPSDEVESARQRQDQVGGLHPAVDSGARQRQAAFGIKADAIAGQQAPGLGSGPLPTGREGAGFRAAENFDGKATQNVPAC